MKPNILQIQHFSIHDGPGIRTVVFFKGCPLKCLWCHNPESWSTLPELSFAQERCIGCGECVRVCPSKCHSFELNTARINRAACTRCGACVEACCGALEWMGKQLTAEEIFNEVMKDLPFYQQSGGGLTLSGGEPLMFAPFSAQLLKLASDLQMHTAIETCGYAPWKNFEQVIPHTRLFLFDVKETDPERHRRFTGVDNALILENLRRLNGEGVPIHLRCPIIPGYNDRPQHFAALAELANELNCVERIDVEPYHPMGKAKAAKLGYEPALPHLGFVDRDTVEQWVQTIQHQTHVRVYHS